MRLFRRNDFMIEDLENRIIELDDFEQETNTPCDDDILHMQDINVKEFKKLHDNVVNGVYIMVLSGLGCCFAFLSLF